MAGSDFLYIDVLGDRNLLRNLDRMPDVVRAILLEKVRSWTERLRDQVEENIHARLNKTSKPKIYSGSPKHLAESVEVEIIEDGIKIDGRVFIAGIPYARIQDEGGAIPPHMIYPQKSKVLAFFAASGDKVFATHVAHPGGQIPASRFMKDAFRDMGPEISRGIKTSVVQGIRAHMRTGR